MSFTFKSVIVYLLVILLGWSLIDTILFLLRRIVLYKIFEKLSELDKNREAVTRQMRFLSETNPENFLNKAIDCHLRVSSVSTKYKNKCKLCEVHDAIEVSVVTNNSNFPYIVLFIGHLLLSGITTDNIL